MQNKVELSWEEIDELTSDIVREINKTGTRFDAIIALGRGGLIPGTIISYKLGIKNLQNLGINTRAEDGQYLETLIYQRPTVSGNVIVIDDINDKGFTFEAVDSLIKKEYQDIDELLYCTLVTKHDTAFKKHTLTGKISYTSDWLVFPWDK